MKGGQRAVGSGLGPAQITQIERQITKGAVNTGRYAQGGQTEKPNVGEAGNVTERRTQGKWLNICLKGSGVNFLIFGQPPEQAEEDGNRAIKQKKIATAT